MGSDIHNGARRASQFRRRQLIPPNVAAVTCFVLMPLVVVACGGTPTAPTTRTTGATLTAISAQSTMFAFTGDPQDFVSRGQSDLLTLQNALFRTTLNTGGVRVIVEVRRTDRPAGDLSSFWLLIIGGVSGRRIQAGSFDTTRAATATTAGLDISGNGGGCNQSTGHMWQWKVRALATDGRVGDWTIPNDLNFTRCRLANGLSCGQDPTDLLIPHTFQPRL